MAIPLPTCFYCGGRGQFNKTWLGKLACLTCWRNEREHWIRTHFTESACAERLPAQHQQTGG